MNTGLINLYLRRWILSVGPVSNWTFLPFQDNALHWANRPPLLRNFSCCHLHLKMEIDSYNQICTRVYHVLLKFCFNYTRARWVLLVWSTPNFPHNEDSRLALDWAPTGRTTTRLTKSSHGPLSVIFIPDNHLSPKLPSHSSNFWTTIC